MSAPGSKPIAEVDVSPSCCGPSSDTAAGRPNLVLLGRSLKFLRPHWRLQLVALALTAVVTVMWVANPWIQKLLVDDLREGSSIRVLGWLVLALVGSSLVRVLLSAVQKFVFAGIRERVLLDLRSSLVDALLRKEILSMKKRNPGEVISVFLQDVETMGSLYGDTIVQLVTQSFLFVAVVILMVTLDRTLAVLTLGALMAFAISVKDITRPIQRVSRELQDALADASTAVGEYWKSMAETRLLGAEAFVHEMVSGALDLLRRARLRFAKVVSTVSLCDGMTWVIAGGLIWYGGQKVIAGQMTLGGLLAFWNYMGLSLAPINTFLMFGGTVRSSLGAAARVFELADAGEDEGRGDRGALDFPSRLHSISCRGVRFGYETDRTVLAELDLELRPGERLGLVGASGSGKSTLASLMTRLLENCGGEILLNGKPLRQYRLSSLRAGLGVVQQKPHIFTATVEENILLGRPWASPDEIVLAASRAHALEFIDELPEGMKTRIGEGLRQLSGGQEQRLAMARLFLKNPRMVILDESLSAVDCATADLIMDELYSYFSGRPVIVISHHPSMLKGVDRILALQDGSLRQITLGEAALLAGSRV